MRATVAQHERILAALKARDEARAERRMRRHVRDFQEHITVSLMGADRVVS